MKIYKGIAGAPGIAEGTLLYFEKGSAEHCEVSIYEAIEMALEKVRTLGRKAHED